MALTKAKLIADGVIDVDNLAAGHSITTSNIGEGSNLYYTDARVASYLTTNSYATEGYVTTAVANLVDSAPSTLDTLNELAAALGDDPNFATTVTNSIATKLPLSGGNITGNFSVDTNTLFVDAANNKVVIGNTVASQAGLTIYAANAATIYQTPTSGTGESNGFYVGQVSDVSYVWNYNAFPMVFSTNNTERLRIDSSGNVGIGTSSPGYTLEVPSTAAIRRLVSSGIQESFDQPQADGQYLLYSNSTLGAVFCGRGSSSDILFASKAGATVFEVPTGTSNVSFAGNVSFTNGNGIDFGASSGSGSTSTLLDDYEEGTWTPVYYGSDTSGTVSYLSRGGTYTKVGNIVTAWFSLVDFSVSGAIGAVIIGGFPFVQSQTNNVRGSYSGNLRTYNVDINDGYNYLTMSMDSGLNWLYLLVSRDNGTWKQVDVENSSNQYIEGYITYRV